MAETLEEAAVEEVRGAQEVRVVQDRVALRAAAAAAAADDSAAAAASKEPPVPAAAAEEEEGQVLLRAPIRRRQRVPVKLPLTRPTRITAEPLESAATVALA